MLPVHPWILLGLLILNGNLELVPCVKSQMIPRFKMTSLTPFLSISPATYPNTFKSKRELDKSQHFASPWLHTFSWCSLIFLLSKNQTNSSLPPTACTEWSSFRFHCNKLLTAINHLKIWKWTIIVFYHYFRTAINVYTKLISISKKELCLQNLKHLYLSIMCRGPSEKSMQL